MKWSLCYCYSKIQGANFALVALTLETNDSQSLLMVIFAHSLDYRHSFNPACLIHQCSFLHFLVVVVNIFCCVKSCWRADPPDTGAEDNGANMNIKTLAGSALGSTVKCGLTDGKTVRASYKMRRPGEFTQRRWNKLNFHNWCWWCSLMGCSVSHGNDDEDHLDRQGEMRWGEAMLLDDEMCLSWMISYHCDFTPG